MPDKDVNIHIKTPGTAESKRKIDATGDSVKKLGDTTDRAGKKGAAGMDKTDASLKKTGGTLDRLTSRLSSFIAGFFGVTALIGGISKAIATELRNISEAADKAAARLRSTRDLMFLGDFAKKHPDVHTEIGAMAERAALGGVEGKVEVATAWEMLVSKTANFEESQRMALMNEALKFRRTTKSDLSTVLNLMIQIRKSDRAATAQQITNLIQQTKTEAGSTTEAMGARLPEILPIGESADLEIYETAGLFAAATSRFEAAKATTGLRIMLGRLQGKELTPQGERVKRRLGLRPDMPVMAQLAALHTAYQSGKVKLPELQTIFGEEGGPLAAAMIQDFPSLVESIEKIRWAYTTPGLDIVGDKLQEVYKPGSLEYEEEYQRRVAARVDQLKFEKDAAKGIRYKTWRDEQYLHYRDLGFSSWEAEYFRWHDEMGYRIDDLLIPWAEDAPWKSPQAPTVIHNVHQGDNYFSRQGTHEGYPFDPNSPRVP